VLIKAEGPGSSDPSPHGFTRLSAYLQQSIVQLSSQQFAAQSLLQQSPLQQSLHLSVQQAGQHALAEIAEPCANAPMASTIDTERTASIRFILKSP
jgi:hypothetical protein